MTDREVNEFHLQIATDLATLKQASADILVQTTKTNGRVTRLEGDIVDHGHKFAVLADRHSNSSKWRDRIATAVVGLLVAAAGAGFILFLQKADILNVSVISDEEYQQLP